MFFFQDFVSSKHRCISRHVQILFSVVFERRGFSFLESIIGMYAIDPVEAPIRLSLSPCFYHMRGLWSVTGNITLDPTVALHRLYGVDDACGQGMTALICNRHMSLIGVSRL